MFGFSPGPWEMLLFLLIAVLLFGKRLPEVARSLGRGITEFKKGLHEIDTEPYEPEGTGYVPEPLERDEPTAPKFQLPDEEDEASEADQQPTNGSDSETKAPSEQAHA